MQAIPNLIPSDSRGRSELSWLKSRFSFSFAHYYNPERVGFESLRVINEDHIAAGAGFPAHPHRDAEIFSYVLSGTLEHEDSLGNGSRVGPGGVQYMSAGRGVRHSEFNPDPDTPIHMLQIWLTPDETGATPRYETRQIAEAEKRGRLKLFLSKEGRLSSMKIRQDVDIYAALLDGTEAISHTLPKGRRGWVQIVRGALSVNGIPCSAGDAVTLEAGDVTFTTGHDAEFIFFDLAALN